MYVEKHDNSPEDVPHGSCLCRVANGVDFAYQAEIWIQSEINTPNFKRAYILGGYGTVYAVIHKGEDGGISYAGRSKDYDGEWQLSPLYENSQRIVSVMFGDDNPLPFNTPEEADTWAAAQFSDDVATVVVCNEENLCMAWERDKEINTKLGVAEDTVQRVAFRPLQFEQMITRCRMALN